MYLHQKLSEQKGKSKRRRHQRTRNGRYTECKQLEGLLELDLNLGAFQVHFKHVINGIPETIHT